MTEREWLKGADPSRMLEFLRGKASDRKLRLFAVACGRRVWPLLDGQWSRHAVEAAERYVEGHARWEELQHARQETDGRMLPNGDNDLRCLTGFAVSDDPPDPFGAYRRAAALVAERRRRKGRGMWGEKAARQEYSVQCSLLRDIFGNPFRPVTINAAWLTSTVVSLATSIYEERAFDRMPILGDALEEAGLTDADVLRHCRQAGDHVLGCWCLDLLLGKE